jgi:hypothetical protein
MISSDAVTDGDGNISGSKILFNHFNQSTPGTLGAMIDFATGAAQAANGMAVGGTTTYRVPGPRLHAPMSGRKIRIDVRRDLRLDMHAAIEQFVDTGTLTTQVFVLDDIPSTNTVQFVAWGSVPTGTSVAIQVYGATAGTACTMSGTATGAKYSSALFTPIAGERAYYAVLTFTPRSDKRRSPTIKRASVYRAAVTRTVEKDETILSRVQSISTTDGGSDPSTETLGVVCTDILGTENARLSEQGGMPITVIAGGVDPSDSEATSTLFRGRVLMASRTQVSGATGRGRTRTALRSGSYGHYNVRAIGPWGVLAKRLAPGRLDLAFARDPTALRAGNADGLQGHRRDSGALAGGGHSSTTRSTYRTFRFAFRSTPACRPTSRSSRRILPAGSDARSGLPRRVPARRSQRRHERNVARAVLPQAAI